MHALAARRTAHLAALLVAALVAAGCGADPARVARDNFSPERAASASTSSRSDDGAGRAGGDIDTLWSRGTPIAATAARSVLLAATRRSTAGERRFDVRVRATIRRADPGVVSGGVDATNVGGIGTATGPWGVLAGRDAVSVGIAGYRTADGASAATVDGRLGLLAGSTSLRIVGDRLYVRRSGTWFDLGPAAGITLDVGRELFAHSPLVRVTAGRRLGDGRVLVRGTVSSRGIAAQARSEPTGLVARALALSTGVRFTALVDDGDLVADEIHTGVRMPDTASRVSGITDVRIELVERYERARDLPPVVAPSGSRRPSSLAEVAFPAPARRAAGAAR